MRFAGVRQRLSHTWPLAVVISLVALLVPLWVVMYLGMESVEHREFERQKPFISMENPSQEADITRDQSMLLDSAPLFLPTRWNTAGVNQVLGEERGMDFFEPFNKEVSLSTNAMRPVLGKSPVNTGNDAMLGAEQIAFSIGRDYATSAVKLAPRDAFMELRRADDGALLLSRTLELPLENIGDRLWQPVEMWLSIVESGVLAEPLLSESSGMDALDDYLSRLVAEDEELALIAPGYYRVVIGP